MAHSNTKYKYMIGDIIKIKKDLVVGEEYDGMFFTKRMEVFKNQIATIIDMNDYDCEMEGYVSPFYEINIDSGKLDWVADMFEGVNSR